MPRTPARLFDAAEEQFGPVDILVNNATGSLADTFAAGATDRLGRPLRPVTANMVYPAVTDTGWVTSAAAATRPKPSAGW